MQCQLGMSYYMLELLFINNDYVVLDFNFTKYFQTIDVKHIQTMFQKVFF